METKTTKEQTKKEKEKHQRTIIRRIVFAAFILLASIIGISVIIFSPLFLEIKLLVISTILIALFFIFFRFTLVNEATAKIVTRLNGFHKVIMKWEGYTLDDEWNVVRGVDRWSQLGLGGLRFVGFWPLDTIYRYNFRWTDTQLVNGVEQPVPHEEEIDYIFVRPDTYFTRVKEAETKASAAATTTVSTTTVSESGTPERIPVDVDFLITLRSNNPWRTLFRGPSNWLENATARFNTLIRTWVAGHSLDQILELKSEPKAIWNDFKDSPLLLNTFPKWGIKIEVNGIELKDVNLPDDIQAAAEEEKKQEFLARGFAAETSRRLVAMIAEITGESMKVVQANFKANPELAVTQTYKDLIAINQDLIKRRLGLGQGISEIHISSPEGLLAGLANIFHGGLTGMPGSTSPKNNNPGNASDASDKPGKKKDKKDDDDEDLDEKLRKTKELMEGGK